MQSSVDNPLWEDAALAQVGISTRVPLSPLEAALQALPMNRPRSGHCTDPSRACSKRGAASSTTAGSDNCCAGNVPCSFEAWRPSSSEVRRALKTQPAADSCSTSSPVVKAGRAASVGAAQGSRSASLSPVCWSLNSDCGDENGVQPHSTLTDSSVWREGVQHAAPVHGSAEVCEWLQEQQHQRRQQQPTSPMESPEAPASPQPMESPLKRLRLSDDFPLQCASPTAEADGGNSPPQAAAGGDSVPQSTVGIRQLGSPGGSRMGGVADGATSAADTSAMQEAADAFLQPAALVQAPVAMTEASVGAAAAAEAGSDPASPCSIGEASVPKFDSCCGTPTAVSRVVVTVHAPSAVMQPTKVDLHASFGSLCTATDPVAVLLAQERSLWKQEVALQAQRRADLAELRSIMSAGAAAHGCTSPAPSLLQASGGDGAFGAALVVC